MFKERFLQEDVYKKMFAERHLQDVYSNAKIFIESCLQEDISRKTLREKRFGG